MKIIKLWLIQVTKRLITFSNVADEIGKDYIKKNNRLNATGCDGIPAKIEKHNKSVLTSQLTALVNLSIILHSYVFN